MEHEREWGLSAPEPETFELSESFMRRVLRWEEASHNAPGQDKSWVERFNEDWREHYANARRVL